MTELLQALTAYLARAGLPVWQAGQIPDPAPFPYAAFTLTAAPFGEPGTLEITGWHLGPGANAASAAYLDALSTLIPPSGALLPCPGGLALLHPSSASIITDGPAIGGRARLDLRLYPKQATPR